MPPPTTPLPSGRSATIQAVSSNWFRYRDASLAAGLFALTAAVFAPAVWYDFGAMDDGVYVIGNEAVRGGLTPDGILWAWTAVAEANWHPLTWMSLELDTTLFGTEPFGYHLTNILLHALNTTLVYLVLRRMTGSIGRSLAVALLFGLHPLRVESVAWVTERKDVLSGLFGLLAILVYAGPEGRGPTRGRMWAVAGLHAASLTAKPMLVTLPCVLLLLDAWPLGRLRRAADLEPLVREKTALFVLAALSCLVTYAVQDGSGATEPIGLRGPLGRVASALLGYTAYLRLTVYPTNLAIFYPLPRGPLPAWQPLAAAALLLAITALGWRFRKPAPYLLVGWLWFLGTLVPVVGLVQVGAQAYADRYTYFPHIGLLLAVVWAAADLMAVARVPVRARLAAALVAVAACAWLTREQLPYWREGLTMWHRVAAVTEPNSRTWVAIARYHMARREYDEALACYDRACEIDPQDEHIRILRQMTYWQFKRSANDTP